MLTPTQPNVPLLRKAVEFAEESAEQYGESLDEIFNDNPPTGTVWYQGDWATLVNADLAQTLPEEAASLQLCGTAYCIAGFVCSLQPGYDATLSFWDNVPEIKETIDGEPFSHSEVAQTVLGLTLTQANLLFDGANSAQDVRLIAEEIAGEKL